MSKALWSSMLALFLLAPGGPALAAATPPALMNYQGVLRGGNGNPLTGSFDMVFRFFDQEAGGQEILSDSHVGGQQVEALAGLFSVVLGGGVVADGAGLFGNDPYLSLDKMFADFEGVWMQMEVDGEVLLPRIRVYAAAYSLNASHLAGRPPAYFLDTSAMAQVKSGSLTVATLDLSGNTLHMNADGPDGDQTLFFFDSGSAIAEAMKWDDAADRFEFSDELAITGPLRSGSTTQPAEAFNHLGNLGDVPDSASMNGVQDLYVEGDVEIESDLFLAGQMFMRDSGADQDQNIWFFNGGSRSSETLKWDDGADRFEFSDELAITGPLRVGSTTDAAEAFNHLGNLGDAPDSEDITGTQDLYVEGDVEVESTLYLGGTLVLRDFGGDQDQYIFFYDGELMDDEWLKWDDANDRFEASDSVHVFGELTALTKNFVQNHPERDDLEVVYTALEGDEAAAFTRGAARTENGIARVALGGTFRLVASPDLGLSAHLTPRGAWSDLYVESVTPEELAVRARPGSPDVAFDYIVFGLRAGFEEFPVVRPRRADAPVPPDGAWAPIYDAVPEAAALSARSRHAAMHLLTTGRTPDDSGSQRLRQAIGMRDPSDPPRPRRQVDDVVGPSAVSAPAPATDGGDLSASLHPIASPAAGLPAKTSEPPAAGTAAVVAAGEPSGARDLPAAQAVPPPLLFTLSGPAAPGDLVVLGPAGAPVLTRADREADPGVLGVVVAPGLPGAATAREALAGAVLEESGETAIVALGGIVPCHADATYGSIRPGDLLITSPTPGHAMRSPADVPGAVIGKALEPLETGVGLIHVLVLPR